MKQVMVRLKERTYPVFIGKNISGLAGYLKKIKASGSVFVISNTTVASLYLGRLVKSLKKAGLKVCSYNIADGEQYKNLQTLEKIYKKAVNCGIDRHSTVIALGGGVVGDIAGFFASSYMRGIPYVQAPTTLLAMVDASIGGKTGVDLKEGKNLVGAFHQPKAVWIDLSTLETLPLRHIKNGMAEVIKYGMIADKQLFDYLEGSVKKGLEKLDWPKIIYRCVKIKAGVVEKDEFERKGLREILNFGHTLGHAIETLSGYKNILHGEAVAVGMNIAAKLSEKKRILAANERKKLENLLIKSGLPAAIRRKFTADKIIAIMTRDKKAKNGKFRLVLPIKIGKVKIVADIKANSVKEVLK